MVACQDSLHSYAQMDTHKKGALAGACFYDSRFPNPDSRLPNPSYSRIQVWVRPNASTPT
ncbi:hypothetical protein FHT15_003646 [Xanthomonas campestris]